MTGRRRPLTALAVVVLVSAACSNAPARTAIGARPNSSSTHARGQAVKFAQCMRDNGVREFPDPDASGELTIDGIANGSSVDPDTEVFKQAIGACRDLEPPGFTGHKRTARQQEAALGFAQCVREHGVKDFPDPTPDGPMVDTRRIPSLAGKDVRSSPLTAAMQTCHELATAAGVTGK